MNPGELLAQVSRLLWNLAADAVNGLADQLTTLHPVPGLTEDALRDRLLEPLPRLPEGNALLALAREVLGELTDGSPIRPHGWRHAPDAPLGLALVLTQGSSTAVLAVSPGPVVDVVVTPGATLNLTQSSGPWSVQVQIIAQETWNASFTPGGATVAPAGEVTITAKRTGELTIGAAQGPGLSLNGITLVLSTSPATPFSVDVRLDNFRAALLPPALAALLGAGRAKATEAAQLLMRADRLAGLRFANGGLRTDLPVRLNLPGVSSRGFSVELSADDKGFWLHPTMSLLVALPSLPLHLDLDGIGVRVPISLHPSGIGADVARIDAPMPDGMGVALALPPVSGGGDIRKTGPGAYAGVLEINLGVLSVQAIGLLQLPVDGQPLSFLVLLGARFPYPGIQLGFGFAIDAVGGLVGINRRVDVDSLRGLVSDGNADRVLFPDNAVARATEITNSLGACFPVARGRFVVGPMLRLNWGGRIVTLSVAVIMDLPNPPQLVLLGRMLIALPDPAVPLIRLQASVLGRVNPSVPLVELLVSLAGSWIVGIPITGEIYLLFRGGDDAVFVLSAGGFHPRYTRPAGVPQLSRLSMDLGGGILGLRAEAYLAVTSNSVQFGAQVHLDATIAGCGVEGHLGLDALFVWEPTLAFSVRVYAGVAVLAFGHRLASVGLDFTLEGPGSWHAFGTGSISILFWDVSLDFDVRWGSAPALTPPAPEIYPQLVPVFARREAWATQQPAGRRAPLTYTGRAEKQLATGELAYPDSILRLSQSVIPLRIPITRFQRASVPEQTWRIDRVELNGGDGAHYLGEVQERFVPGDFFVMTADEQLARPAYESYASGWELSDTDVVLDAAHVVDDSYETAYEVEPGWFDRPPRRSFQLGIGRHLLEIYARPVPPSERADRWRAAQDVLGDLVQPVVMNR